MELDSLGRFGFIRQENIFDGLVEMRMIWFGEGCRITVLLVRLLRSGFYCLRVGSIVYWGWGAFFIHLNTFKYSFYYVY